ncbi:molecular chaperone DnaJ [Zavarzinella formosa]|uniref:molecular chaperone DnaJ n=1 Tax=Zavarzinella formosa TaxID=360055 RepID=UPI0002D76539|nr:molecular chaperone DnaJ [Zavarzinella formosa]
MAMKRDYYEVLTVSKEVEIEVIEKTYRKLARQYHPDRNVGDPEAEVKFKEINEAFEVLGDPEKRARYDRYGHAGLEGGEGFGPASGSFSDIVNDLFGAFMGGGGQGGNRRGGQRGPQRGSDLRMPLDIDLLEAARGVKKPFKVRRQEICLECTGTGSKSNKKTTCPRCKGKGEFVQRQGFFELRQACPQCNGSGSVIADPCVKCSGAGKIQVEKEISVSVPPGSDTGLRLFVGGEGNAGDPGAPRGDLELVVRVAEHSMFKREGVDLFVDDLPITFSQAALGATVDIPTLNGKSTLNVPAGTQTGTEFRIRGEGMPELRVSRQGTPIENSRKGDLRVTVNVETPTHLTKRQEELLRELAEIEHRQVSPARRGFFDKIKNLFTAPADTEPTH